MTMLTMSWPSLGLLHCRYGYFLDETRLYLVMEYVEGGELFTHLRAAVRWVARRPATLSIRDSPGCQPL